MRYRDYDRILKSRFNDASMSKCNADLSVQLWWHEYLMQCRFIRAAMVARISDAMQTYLCSFGGTNVWERIWTKSRGYSYKVTEWSAYIDQCNVADDR